MISLENIEKWVDHIAMLSAGIDEKIRFFTMSPLMTKVATESDFKQCDITYDECKQYPYILMLWHLTPQ